VVSVKWWEAAVGIEPSDYIVRESYSSRKCTLGSSLHCCSYNV